MAAGCRRAALVAATMACGPQTPGLNLTPCRLKALGSGARFLARAIGSRYNPLLAQVVVTRRCNLACGYCNEYDDFSPPVPLNDLLAQIDRLAALGTASITFNG